MINSPSIWGALKDAAEVGVFHLVNSGVPVNGTTGKYIAGKGCLLTDILTGILYVNTGTKLVPAWTTAGSQTFGSLANAWALDPQGGQSVPVTDNQPSVTLASGIRVFGNGLADNDSGVVVSILPEGAIATMIASANAGETIAAGVGNSASQPYKPGINGAITLQTVVRMVTDHLNRKFFFGLVTAPIIDGVLAPETFAAGNFTLGPTNLVGFVTDTAVGTTRDFYALSNKLNLTPVISAASALLPAQFPVTPAWVTLKLTVDVDGTAEFFVDDVLVKTIPQALDPTVAVAPLLLLGNTLNGATRSMDVKQFTSIGK
jgi:hypothetical protein